MRTGPLNRYVKVWRNVQIGTDPLYNTPIFEDSVVAEFWAALVPKSEEERFAASQIYASQVVVFRAHFMELTETDRLECEGKTYNIAGLREIGYRAGLEITAKWMAE